MPKSGPAIDQSHMAAIERLERLANSLDARFRVPGTHIRFGWDSILGLIPGIGDVVTIGPAVYLILQGRKMGARKRALARMTANTTADLVIGGIPILGDAFDAVFKANRRNLGILKRDLAGQGVVIAA